MPHNLPQHIGRLLLFKIGAIGDVLLTTPLIRALREHFPKSQIDYLTGAWSAPALQNNPHLNNIIEFDDEIMRRRNISKLLNLAAQVRRRKYDVIVVLDPGWQAGLLATFFGSSRLGFDRNGEGKFHHHAIPFEETTHDNLQYLALGKLLGASSENTALEFFPSVADKQFAQEILGDILHPGRNRRTHPCIAICPGGGENPYQSLPEKRWPAESYRKLVRMLESQGHAVVILGGKNDQALSEAVATSQTVNLVGQTPLGQTAAVLKECNLVVTHDNGLLHLAAAAGTPTLALFGPTDPRRLAPLGKQHRFIWKAQEPCYCNGTAVGCGLEHDLARISVREVAAATTAITSQPSAAIAPGPSSAQPREYESGNRLR